MRYASAAAYKKVRALCTELPGVTEVETPTELLFRVGAESFAALEYRHGQRASKPTLSLRVEPEGLMAEPGSRRLDVRHHSSWPGWVSLQVGGGGNWDEVADLVMVAYVGVAPKRMLQALDRRPALP